MEMLFSGSAHNAKILGGNKIHRLSFSAVPRSGREIIPKRSMEDALSDRD